MKSVEEYSCKSEVSWLQGETHFLVHGGAERGILAATSFVAILADRHLGRWQSLACISALATSFVDILADRHVLNVNAMYDLYSIRSIDGIHLILICRTVQRGMFIARTAAYRLK